MRLKKWLIKNVRFDMYFWMLLLFIPYVIIFALTGHFREPVFYVHSPVDDLIPFNEWFIIPYVMWFLYVALLLAYFLIKDVRSYLNYMVASFVGLYLCDLFFIICPNGLTFRPETLPDNFAGWLCGFIFAVDNPTNVFPSIHVMISWLAFMAILESKTLKSHKWIYAPAFILSFMITLSTMYLKQHSFIDAVGGIIAAAILYIVFYRVKPIQKKIDAFYEKHPPKIRDI